MSLVVTQLDFVILQIVGSAPGFPHGIIDPIEVKRSSGFVFGRGRAEGCENESTGHVAATCLSKLTLDVFSFETSFAGAWRISI